MPERPAPQQTEQAPAASGPIAVEEQAPSAQAPAGDVLGLQRSIGNRAVAQMAGPAAAPALIVDDDAPRVDAGRMRKSEFMNEVRKAVCSTADEAMAPAGRTSEGCPYISYWIDYYSAKPAAHVNRALHKFAPEAGGLADARNAVPLLAARVRRSVDQWVRTGEITGMPEGEMPTFPGAGLFGGLFFKAREGGARPADPHTVARELGPGEAFGGSARSGMESAFGADFSRVRLHTGSRAGSLASGMNARAFTIGDHVAFASNEYRPGTQEGDALLAHELAHVAQQRNGSGAAAGHALESDADRSASAAVVSLWTGRRRRAQPLLGSGVQLRRCGDSGPKRYKWKDEKLKKKVDNDIYSAPALRSYIDGLTGNAREDALHDVQFGRLDYKNFLDTLKKGDPAIEDLKESISKLDDLVEGLYRDQILAKAPGVDAPLTEYAPGTAPAALTAGTHPLSAKEKAGVEAALSPVPEIDPQTGKPVKFNDVVDGKHFKDELRARFLVRIDEQFKSLAEGKAVAHADPTKLHGFAYLEQIATAAQHAVDSVFHAYARRTAFVAGTNLIDRWEQQETAIAAADPDQKKAIAFVRVLKIFKDDKIIREIKVRHGFVVDRDPEQGIVDGLMNELADDATLQTKLLEIHKGWEGSADPATKQVFIQRFKSPTDAGNRAFGWLNFRILMHEYIHTLTHSKYDTYVNSLPEEKAHILREGMTDAMTNIAWANVDFADETLRAQVEGPFHDPAIHDPLAPPRMYPGTRNAEQIIATVGLNNAAAAYFLGEAKLIGAP